MSPEISAIILAGGQASRMNHVNKGLKLYQNNPLVSYVIKSIAGQVDDIVISANRDIEVYQQYGYPVIADEATSKGPLSGIASAVKQCKHDLVFITACDMPYLPKTIVESLKKGMTGRATVAKSGDRIEPLVSLVRRECTEDIPALLAADNRSVKHWLEQCGAVAVAIQDADQQAFLNINTESELGS